jgi:hypothetical protein
MAAGFEKDQISDLSNVGMGIGRRDRDACNLETLQVVDVVAEVRD